MANQIVLFTETKPHGKGVAGLAAQINDACKPRMHRQLFAPLEGDRTAFRPLLIAAAGPLHRPAT